MKHIALSLKNLSFSFDDSRKKSFFSSLSGEFEQQKIHFIRGKNGAGKSTLFRILQGQIFSEEHCSGTIIFQGKKLNMADQQSRDYLHEQVRIVPQKFDLMLADRFTFKQNLQLANLPHVPTLSTLPEKYTIPELVHRFNIDYDTPVHLLSGGQRQILAILMALQKSATTLLLDEPTAALDDKNALMVMEFLHHLITEQPTLTILIICHDKELVEAYAQEKNYFEIEVTETTNGYRRELVTKDIAS